MRTDQEIIERARVMFQRNRDKAPAERGAEIISGKRYRDGRGRMVTILSASPLAVEYSREGYGERCTVGRREFEMKFTEVKS